MSRALAARTAGKRLIRAWTDLQLEYDQRHDLPAGSRIEYVANVNDEATLRLIDESQPELLVVSGTNLVGRKLLERMRDARGILNLHTGISPYVKGGPNCTNWCLSEGLFHLIGNSIMWLDAGIDSGPLCFTERTPLSGNESLLDLHRAVMDHGHAMYLAVLDQLAAGKSVPRVPQASIAAGRTFYTAEWTAAAMRRAVKRFDRDYSRTLRDNDLVRTLLRDTRLVDLAGPPQ